MKKIILLIFISFPIAFTNYSKAQDSEIKVLFQRFAEFYNSGDLVNAEEVLFSVLNSKVPVPEKYLVPVYINLGATDMLLGRYENALEYNDKAEKLIANKDQKSKELATIFNNKAIIYNVQKSFDMAIPYLEKSIRIYMILKNDDKSNLQSLSSIYLNLGIAYLETENYKLALDYFNKSADLKSENNLSGIALVYLNIAKTFVKTENPLQAEEFYLKSISSFKKEFGEDYYRMAEVYFDYGLFLRSVGKNTEALEAHQKALYICLKNYGEKHTLVSLSYKHLGDNYMIRNDYRQALIYYQKSLIAVVNDFNDPDIFTNPSIDSALFNIRLLDNLKSKSQALELLAGEQSDRELKLKILNKSLETIELALQLIDRIRNNYLSEDSRIYLSENEKETYIFATHIAFSLFNMTNDKLMGQKMYDIAKKAKAAILRNEISENELLWSAGIPDSLRKKQNNLTGNIAAYNNLLLEEMRKIKPDSNKVTLWKDALFDMNREKEKVADEINKESPEYHDILQKTEPISLSEIQRQLKSDETIVDYLLSNQNVNGERKLYTFLITKEGLKFLETTLDSLFIKNAEIIQKSHGINIATSDPGKDFKDYTGALYYMYENLIKSAESLLRGNKLIIIPDEEIAWLPFDAFLKNKPRPDQTDYEGLQYLINDYTFSFGYSSSLIFSKKTRLTKGEEVFAFLPYYGKDNISGTGLDSLQGAGTEIKSIYKWFSGKKFIGNKATEANFKKEIGYPAIFHLAMHSLSDSINSRYSYFIFDTTKDTLEDGRLYNYEISLSRIKSPMVVLSACNSGTGTLYHGEGLMSLARGFILAGASSVIKTAWEVNDEASAAIVTRFYYHLSKGKPKDEAMRLAKLEYLKGSSPSLTSPYFWAAYEVMGDNAPLVRNFRTTGYLITGVVFILIAGLLIFYFRRRRIFSARPE